MHRVFIAPVSIAVGICTVLGHGTARAQNNAEIAFLSRAMTVTLLNVGGKSVAVDMKHIPQGGQCRMDSDATVVKIGDGDKPGTVKVRYVAPQLSQGGCPFMTIFDLSADDYLASRTVFLKKEQEAKQRVEQIKKDIAEKWDEIFGKRI